MIRLRRPHHQRGFYAVEYAFVFLFLFGLIYGIVCYGILFTFKLGLQAAAEDAARAALRHQVGIPARQAQAELVAQQRTAGWWPPAAAPLTISSQLEQADASCGRGWLDRCSLTVTIQASQLQQVLPPIPGFALPDRLTGQASVLLDGRTL